MRIKGDKGVCSMSVFVQKVFFDIEGKNLISHYGDRPDLYKIDNSFLSGYTKEEIKDRIISFIDDLQKLWY